MKAADGMAMIATVPTAAKLPSTSGKGKQSGQARKLAKQRHTVSRRERCSALLRR